MNKKRLGKSDMEITPIGVGAWAMGGGGWQYGWGPQNDADSIAAIHEALDRGVNWIDTAAIYGLGHSEEIVGRAIRTRSDRPYIFTKCGMVRDEKGNIINSLNAASIRAECEASLRRLQVDVIDLYQIHWPKPPEQIEEAWGELERMREEGKVRHIGVSNFDVFQMWRVRHIAPVTSLQPPYSLLARDVERGILPFALKHDIGTIVYSPMYSGLLSGVMSRDRILRLPKDDWRRSDPNFQDPLLTRNLRLVCLLRDIGQSHGRIAGEVAIAWTLNNPAVTGAIVGVRSRDQVAGVIGAGDFKLSRQEIYAIEEAMVDDEALPWCREVN